MFELTNKGNFIIVLYEISTFIFDLFNNFIIGVRNIFDIFFHTKNIDN